MRFQVLIVDDEPLAREGLRTKLQDDPEIDVVGECANGHEAVIAIRTKCPELVFLDVQMPLLDGFGVIEVIDADKMPVVIFVTAYDEFALRAFEAHALDYLLKPVNDERLRSAVARAKKQIERANVNPYSKQLADLLRELRLEREGTKPKQKYQNRISYKAKDRIVFLEIGEIEWIESMDNYVQLNASGKSHMIRETMNRMESRLDPAKFLRVRRSTIVSIRHIKELQPMSNGEYVIVLNSGARLQSSRRYRKNLDSILPT